MLQTVTSVALSPIPLVRWHEVAHPERALRRGALVKVRPGVYAPTREWDLLAPWERYLARVHAVAIVQPDAVFSHESAAVLLGLPIFGDPLIVHVLAPPGTTARLVAGLRTHNWTGDRQLVRLGGIVVTSAEDTAVDLARARHPAIGLSVADAALRHDGDLSAAQLAAINESRSSKRGRALARWPLRNATPLAATAVESVSRAVIEWLGFPAPALQVILRSRTGETDRPDFLWGDIAIAGESDGDLKYDGRFGTPTDVLKRQRVRDSRLREQLRAVVHWGWFEATNVDSLRTLLLGHGLRPSQPESATPLISLRRALAPNPPHRLSPNP